MSRKERYLADLCNAKKRIAELEGEVDRLRDTIHRLVTLKQALEERVAKCEEETVHVLEDVV